MIKTRTKVECNLTNVHADDMTPCMTREMWRGRPRYSIYMSIYCQLYCGGSCGVWGSDVCAAAARAQNAAAGAWGVCGSVNNPFYVVQPNPYKETARR